MIQPADLLNLELLPGSLTIRRPVATKKTRVDRGDRDHHQAANDGGAPACGPVDPRDFDNRAIFQAASLASKAANFVMGRPEADGRQSDADKIPTRQVGA
jgi:hypothetical protein